MECQGESVKTPPALHGVKWLILFGSRFAGVHVVPACSARMVSMILTCIATWYYMVTFHGVTYSVRSSKL
jgi:hypothetical protein